MLDALASIRTGCLRYIYAFSVQDRRPPSEEVESEKLREWDLLQPVHHWHISRIDHDSIF